MLREIQGTDNKSFSPVLGVNKVGWSLAGVLPFSPMCYRLLLLSTDCSKIQGLHRLRNKKFFTT